MPYRTAKPAGTSPTQTTQAVLSTNTNTAQNTWSAQQQQPSSRYGQPASRYRQTAYNNQALPPAPPQAAPVPSQMPPAPPYRQEAKREPVYLPLPGGHSLNSQSGTPAQGSMSGEVFSDQWQSSPSEGVAYPNPIVPPDSYSQGCGPDCNHYHYTDAAYQWTLLPTDLLWQSYLGGPREPRLGQSIVFLDGTGWLWELEAGGRAGLLRYGSGPGEELEGFQLDIWGAATPRLNMHQNTELDAVDFFVGVPLTWRRGPFQAKLEWYHVSAHLGDEFLLRPENAGFNRLDYLRDAIVLGGGYFPTPDWRVYAEADYAYNTNGGAKPWHFNFGVDYSPCCPTPITRPQPFAAINGNLREEVNWSGGVNFVAGLQWRGQENDHLFRTGLHYYAGQSLQYSFLGDYEEFIGWGMWMDF
ncbi:DUF1207 domain-containing protein [Rubinisphaera brasiliensis]|nr:DUF1207 domain-containing protein [Rubinisphaera brasiliensis]